MYNVCVLLSESIDGGSEKKCIDWISNLMGRDCSKSKEDDGAARASLRLPNYVFESTIVAERGFLFAARAAA